MNSWLVERNFISEKNNIIDQNNWGDEKQSRKYFCVLKAKSFSGIKRSDGHNF